MAPGAGNARVTVRRRLDVPMLRPWPSAMRIVILVALVSAMVINGLTGGPVMRQVDPPTPPHTTYVTTVVGPPAPGHTP